MQPAFWPQAPGQGSRHFWLMHASVGWHSELVVHSGPQPLALCASPKNPGRQAQTALLADPTAQSAFGPHGDGRQTSTGVLRHWPLESMT